MYKPTQKGKMFHISKSHVTMTKKKNLIKCYVTKTKKVAYTSNEIQFKNHSLTFIHKNKSLPSATSILSCSTMAHNNTDSLDKLICTDYVDFGKHQDRFGRISWSKNDSNYLDIKLKLFKREDKNAVFRLRQNFTMGEADFSQFMRQRVNSLSQQTTFSENKICRQFFSLHCPKTWTSN